MRIWESLLGLVGAALSPERCAACDEPVGVGRAFCGVCAGAIDAPPANDERATAVGAFGGSLARAIHRLKYEGRAELARPLGDLLARAGRGWAMQSIDAVVPVPLAEDRLIERGYNQAALLAARAARAWGVRHAPLALVRTRSTGQLAKQGRTTRLESARGAFAAGDVSELRGRRVVLVDDVLTTGATLGDASRCATEAGATVVGYSVVALVERRLPERGASHGHDAAARRRA